MHARDHHITPQCAFRSQAERMGSWQHAYARVCSVVAASSRCRVQGDMSSVEQAILEVKSGRAGGLTEMKGQETGRVPMRIARHVAGMLP